jgi:predicted  nucleic acid-binding Zn-ribbon protein
MDDRELLGRIAEKVGKIDVLVEAQKRLEENQAKMELAIGKMADAVTKLAVIEERQDRVRSEVVAMGERILDIRKQHNESIQRIATRVESLESRIDTLERTEPMNAQVRQWVISAILAASVAAVVFVAGRAGLL